MKVERSIEIAASPEAIFAVVMDPARLGEWVTIHDELKSAPDGPLRKGSKLEQSLKVAGQRFDVSWTVAEAKRPSRIVWEGRGPARTTARAVYELAPVASGTRFDYLNEYELPGGALGSLAGRAISRRAGKESEESLLRLKALMEG